MSAMLALGACHGEPPPPAPPAVVVALPLHPTDAGGGESMRYPVEVAARYANIMSFRVAGKLVERKVRLGDPVHKGQVVARLDATDAEKQAAAARSALDASDHRLVFAKQQIDRDKAQFEQNLIAANQMEQTEDAYSAALAARDQAADQWGVARNTLQYNVLVADHDGVITSENADTGQVLSAGQAVYGLAWSGDIDVVLDAAASDVGKIAGGQTATVTFPALPGHRFDAHVREVAPAADPQSRTYRVKLTLTEGAPAVRIGMTGDAILAPSTQRVASGAPTGIPAAPGRAAPGMPAAPTAMPVALRTALPAAPTTVPLFKIPATAIFHHGQDPAVWVIRAHDSTLELRPVTVHSYSERSAIVSGGLAEGENLVLAGVHTVYAGQHVKPVKPLFSDEESDETAPPSSINDGHASGVAEGLLR
jgi:RND family efflux transporter MFP subunit